jgi:hypothetical protein
MKYFYLEPEVAGGLGPGTVMDSSAHPPKISKLNYQFDDWLGDVLLEAFPCFIITKEGRRIIEGQRFTGICFDDVEITTSDLFQDLFPDGPLPEFNWLKVLGHAAQDDFGISIDHRLVVSERVLKTLNKLGISNALVHDF